jgi:hypothetical protein
MSEYQASPRDKAYIDGQVAFLEGAEGQDNPHSFLLHPRLAIAWMMGWRAAFVSDAKRREGYD